MKRIEEMTLREIESLCLLHGIYGITPEEKKKLDFCVSVIGKIMGSVIDRHAVREVDLTEKRIIRERPTPKPREGKIVFVLED